MLRCCAQVPPALTKGQVVDMKRYAGWIALLVMCAADLPAGQSAVTPDGMHAHPPVRIRPPMLAQNIEQFAGQPVEVSGARAVVMFGPRVLVIDTAGRFADAPPHRDRILVLVEGGEIHVRPDRLLGSLVRVTGVARTLLGMQLTGEVPWPAELDRSRLDRLDIRAAVLATSLQTPDGVDLTVRTPSGSD